jgi:hypothetical protein
MRLPVRLRWIFLTVLAVWIGGGLVFQSPRNGDVDPIEAAKPRYITDNNLELVLTADGPSDMIGCLQNCWFAGSSDSKVVLYRDTREDRYDLGLLGQYGNEWHRTGGNRSRSRTRGIATRRCQSWPAGFQRAIRGCIDGELPATTW